jgi:predicted transcriptional regulator
MMPAMEITLRTTDKQAEALRRQAAAEGRSVEAVAMSAIEDYIARQAEEAKAAALEAFIVGLGNPR